jgi:hypothetical protein
MARRPPRKYATEPVLAGCSSRSADTVIYKDRPSLYSSTRETPDIVPVEPLGRPGKQPEDSYQFSSNFNGSIFGSFAPGQLDDLLNGYEQAEHLKYLQSRQASEVEEGRATAGPGAGSKNFHPSNAGDAEDLKNFILDYNARLEVFHTTLSEGYIPIDFWRATEPRLRVRIILNSSPAPATLFVNGAPTAYSTLTDLYKFPEDIKASTLRRDGYAPCRVEESIIPGLELPDGGEALQAKCVLSALAPNPAAGLRRLH